MNARTDASIGRSRLVAVPSVRLRPDAEDDDRDRAAAPMSFVIRTTVASKLGRKALASGMT